MNILLIGGGGRENAIAFKISESNYFRNRNSKLYCAPGNPGINKYATPIDISISDIKSLKKFAIDKKIDLTVVGPELPLSLGIADEFISSGLKIFGPTKYAAQIETSKIFSKELMKKCGVLTSDFKTFSGDKIKEAFDYIDKKNYPLVIKADGLASGKGVIICNNKEEAEEVINNFTKNNLFGEAGKSFVIEDYLEGYEISIFAISDGENYVLLPSAQDHKKIGENDTGKNTGGMGAYAPADKLISEKTLYEIKKNIIEPVLKELNNRGYPYVGCLYCGLMLKKVDNKFRPYVIEFNARFGDPETQAILPLIKSDFLELLINATEGNIKDFKPQFYNSFACCVILSSKGYPDNFEKGKEIYLGNDDENSYVFHSGTTLIDGKLLTSGGRVLSVTGLSNIDIKTAIDNAYKRIESIKFDNMYYRNDIGKKYFKFIKEV